MSYNLVRLLAAAVSLSGQSEERARRLFKDPAGQFGSAYFRPGNSTRIKNKQLRRRAERSRKGLVL